MVAVSFRVIFDIVELLVDAVELVMLGIIVELVEVVFEVVVLEGKRDVVLGTVVLVALTTYNTVSSTINVVLETELIKSEHLQSFSSSLFPRQSSAIIPVSSTQSLISLICLSQFPSSQFSTSFWLTFYLNK